MQYCMLHHQKFRLQHIKVNLRYFEATILTIIILSSFTLAAEDPVHRSSRKNDVLKVCVHFRSAFDGLITPEVGQPTGS